MLSLREAIRSLNLPDEFSLRRDLRSWPPSLRELIRIANLPPPNLADLSRRRILKYVSDDAQGVAHGLGGRWFMSSKDEIRSFRIEGVDATQPDSIEQIQSVDLESLFAQTDLSKEDRDVNHIGDIAFAHGLLFIPVRHAASPRHFLLATDEAFNVVGYHRLSPPAGEAWCAFHEWTGLLYLPDVDVDSRWMAFDPSAFVARVSDRPAWGTAVALEPRSDRDYHLENFSGGTAAVAHTQGIVFTPTGTVYLTRYDPNFPQNSTWDNYLQVFSSLTGRRFSDGDAGITEINFSGWRDEIEGVAFHEDGVLYLTVAEHDVWPADDDYDLYAFSSGGDRPL
jgi:hypothetical protein